ncbi:PHO85 cyclin-1 [Coemansia sp. Benny D115]|nr:PHO85 cyclin-1 [Coemansia sp. Benny D115]
MSTVVAASTGTVAHLQLCSPVSTGHSQLLMHTAACSLRALLRTEMASARPEGPHTLRENFGHMLPNEPAMGAPAGIAMASSSRHLLPSIEVFVALVTGALGTKTAVLVTALVYVERLGKRLPRSATGAPDTPYRIFLAALLLAEKFWSDRSVAVKNLVAAAGGAFGQREIAAMERALLKLLGFNLYVSAAHIRAHATKMGFVIDEDDDESTRTA